MFGKSCRCCYFASALLDKPLGVYGADFYKPDTLLDTQPTVSDHQRELHVPLCHWLIAVRGGELRDFMGLTS